MSDLTRAANFAKAPVRFVRGDLRPHQSDSTTALSRIGRASLVTEATGGSDPNLVIAALLHDAVEDQEVPLEIIAREFGKQVADIVMEVTDDKSLPKEDRKRKQIEAAPKKSKDAKLIKLHKTQLASDRTSCRSALANQVRLILHTAAYWLMLTVRDAIPKARELATAEFATLRLRLLKIAARVVETTSRIRLAFAAACPEADLFRSLPGALLPLGP